MLVSGVETALAIPPVFCVLALMCQILSDIRETLKGRLKITQH